MAEVNLASVATIIPGNLGWNLTNSTGIKFTVTAEYVVKINTIIAANVDGTADATVDVHIAGMGAGATGLADGTVSTHEGDATVYIAKGINVPAGSSLVLLSNPIYLMEGDTLKSVASATGDIDLFVSYETLLD